MENQNTPNPKYVEIKEHLIRVLKTAKKLGLQIRPGGGYSMGYDMNNLPPFAVGLFGALSIVEGQGARCKLGLTFDETEALEAGFNGGMPNSIKKKKKGFKVNEELMKIGFALRQLFNDDPRTAYQKRLDAMLSRAKLMPEPQGEMMEMEAVAPNHAVVEVEKKAKEILLANLAAGLQEKVAQIAPAASNIKINATIEKALSDGVLLTEVNALGEKLVINKSVPPVLDDFNAWPDHDDDAEDDDDMSAEGSDDPPFGLSYVE